MYHIDPATGSVCLEVEDWSLNGDIPLFFTRRYSNLTSYVGPFGPGWMHVFDLHLTLVEGELQLVDAEARGIRLPGLLLGKPFRDPIDGYVGELSSEGYAIFDAGGSKLTFSSAPDPSGRYLLIRRDEIDENSLWFYYDGSRLSELRSSSGHRIQFRYSGSRIRELIDLRSGRTLSTYQYDSAGQLIRAFGPEGMATAYECSSGLITRITNRLGGSDFFEYDEKRRAIRTWQDPPGFFRSIEYDDPGHRALVTDSLGQRTLLRFNELGLLEETVRFDGSSIRQFYGDANGPVAVEGSPEPESQYTYDEYGNITQEVEPDGAVWEWAYDSRNRIIQETSPDGAVCQFQFDDQNHIRRYLDARGGATLSDYDELARLTAETLPLGNRVRAERGRNAMRVSDALGPLYETREDQAGNITEIHNSTGSVTRFDHDEAGRIVGVGVNGHRATNSFDAEGNLIAETDFIGNLTRYRRDFFGRLLNWTSSLGVTYSYDYDSEGRLIGTRSSEGPACQFEHDWQGRVTRIRLRDGREETYTYDENGNRNSVAATGNIRTEYEYTPVGLVSSIRNGGNTATFEYDTMGNLTVARSGEHLVRRVNAPGELVVREQQGKFALDYEYNAVGLVSKRTDSFGRVTSYDYNIRGQLKAIQDSFFGEYRFEYDDAGSISREIFPNGITRHFSFNQTDELRRCEIRDANGTLRQGREYTYDGNGEILRETSGQESVSEFLYDAGRQLLRVSGSSVTPESFAYDGDANLLRYGNNPDFVYRNGLLTDAADLHYEYDEAGRVVRRKEGSREYQFEYGLGGLISKVILPDGSVCHCEYDALGRRTLKRCADGTVTRYFWDAETLLAETRTNGKSVETRFYLFLPDSFVPLAHSVGDNKFYYNDDQRGTVREVYDSQGNTAARFRYLAFGRREILEQSRPEADCPFRLLGQYFDEETGLHYNRFRYFDPAAARFLSADLWSHEVETNPYSYGLNPIGWNDPMGLDARRGAFTKSGSDSIKEANRKKNNGWYKCSHCGFTNKNKVFAESAETGRPVGDGSFHADHKKSLGSGGTGNAKRNGQVLGGTCNCSKGKRKKPGMT